MITLGRTMDHLSESNPTADHEDIGVASLCQSGGERMGYGFIKVIDNNQFPLFVFVMQHLTI